MVLLIEFFQHNNPDRQEEYTKCLSDNVINDYIDIIEIIVTDDVIIPISSPKIVVTKLEYRPTYQDFFRICNEKYLNEYCIIANSDIIFTDLSMINDDTMENRFVALSRWDIRPNGEIVHFDREDSQDVWIFKSPISFKTPPNFLLGKPGCDNRIAYMAWESGLIVNNPSKQIITKHLHLTNLRNYTVNDTIYGFHMRVKSCGRITDNSIQTRFNYTK